MYEIWKTTWRKVSPVPDKKGKRECLQCHQNKTLKFPLHHIGKHTLVSLVSISFDPECSQFRPSVPPSTDADSADAAPIVRAGQEMQLAHINELNLRSRPSLALNKLNGERKQNVIFQVDG